LGEGSVLVSGATGLVGQRLVPRLVEKYARVHVLSRAPQPERAGIVLHRWDGVDPGAAAVAGVDAIVHLAGEPLFGGVPTRARLDRVRASRVDSTRRIVERVAALPSSSRPKAFVCASAVGIYGDRGDEPLDESSAPGTGFLVDLCRDWEAEARAAESLGVRVVRVRIGVVLAREGGALALMRRPFALGVGGRLGDGRQFFPWIHIDDLVAATVLVLARAEVSGAVNGVAPTPVRNAELTDTLAEVLRRPAVLPVPGFAVRALLGPLADELLGSKRVVPKRLLDAGFSFRFPELRAALEAEVTRPARD